MELLPKSSQNINSPSGDTAVGKKRKRSASYQDDGQPAEKYLELAEKFTLDCFSDEVLFEIFRHLDTFTLLSLQKVCTRFYGLVQDHRLWVNIDVMSSRRSTMDLKFVLKRAHKKTRTVKLNGLFGAEDHCKGKDTFECVLSYLLPKSENLVDLELHNIFIDFLHITIQDFPASLKRLVFRDVSVRWPENAPTVFQKMDRTLTWLEELRVELCTWFHPYDIMLFSKCPSLKRLSLRGCQNLADFVPYGSMASRFGFKTLEYLDVRDTPITDSDLQCFNAILTLKELLLQCPSYMRAQPKNHNKPGSSSSSSSSSKDSTSGFSTSRPSCSCNNRHVRPSISNGLVPLLGGRPSTSRDARINEFPNVMMTIDLQNHSRTVILHGRVSEVYAGEPRRVPREENPQGHFGNLLQHPHFWDMIDRQTCHGVREIKEPLPCPITNRGISCFGRPANPIDQNVIWIRIGHRPSDNTFERLVLRHYRRITDDSLRHLVQCSPNLVYLDVTGTGVTPEGVNHFKNHKPNCVVVCDHLDTI